MLIPGPLALTRSWVSAMYLVREAPGLLDFSSIPAILSLYSGLDPQISFFLNPPYIIFNIYEFPWDVDGILAWGGESDWPFGCLEKHEGDVMEGLCPR